jgi:uncharacterized protein
MSAADDRALVDHFYEARGDRDMIDQVMSQDVVWDITTGFPRGGVYRGLDAVLGEFLAPVAAEFASLAAVPKRLFADGDGHVTAVGHYAVSGRDGGQVECRFVHVWTIADGQLNHLHQTADSHLLQDLWQGSRR